MRLQALRLLRNAILRFLYDRAMAFDAAEISTAEGAAVQSAAAAPAPALDDAAAAAALPSVLSTAAVGASTTAGATTAGAVRPSRKSLTRAQRAALLARKPVTRGAAASGLSGLEGGGGAAEDATAAAVSVLEASLAPAEALADAVPADISMSDVDSKAEESGVCASVGADATAAAAAAAADGVDADMIEGAEEEVAPAAPDGNSAAGDGFDAVGVEATSGRTGRPPSRRSKSSHGRRKRVREAAGGGADDGATKSAAPVPAADDDTGAPSSKRVRSRPRVAGSYKYRTVDPALREEHAGGGHQDKTARYRALVSKEAVQRVALRLTIRQRDFLPKY